MGSFLGHIVPGSFFFFFGIWGLLDGFITYYSSRYRRVPYRNRSVLQSLVIQSCCPWEAFLKVFAVLFGIFGEFITGFDSDGHLALHNAQHMTMFAFFGLHGFCEVLMFYKTPCLPRKTDYLLGLTAFIMEGVLFSWHLMGRTALDIQVHTFLIYAIWASSLFTFLEMLFEKEVIFLLLRCCMIILQGSWFWQVGFILYSPFGTVWNQEGHHETLLVSMFFTWHVAGIVLGGGFLGFATFTKVKARYKDSLPCEEYSKIESLSLLEEET